MIDIALYKDVVPVGPPQHRWQAMAGNGLIVGASTEPYTSRRKAIENVELLFGIDVTSFFPKGAREFDVTLERWLDQTTTDQGGKSGGATKIRVHTS